MNSLYAATSPVIPRLRMTGVRKDFGATRALKSVSFEALPGEVHALIGENGAGKSTLMKILSGALRPDAGTIEIDGQPFLPANPLHARRSGIEMIYQELTLAPHLSVEENILLGREPARLGWLSRARRRELARQSLTQLQHENIPLDAHVRSRTIAEQQVVEIARAMLRQPKVLIMDEPTSSLTQVDTENLFTIIDRMRRGGVCVIYISHFLEECQRIANRFTVLRDGRSVATGEMASATIPQIIQSMVGHQISEIYPRSPRAFGEPVLELRGLAGRAKPRSASLTLRAGEILGLAGLVGAGRTETLRACFGLDRIKDGIILVRSKEETHRTPAQRLASGLGLLSENRKEEGLMLNRSVADNLTMTHYGPFTHCGFIQSGRHWQAARNWMSRLDVRSQNPDQPVGELSGGNQQKIALGRLLHHNANVLLLDEPTRGIDVGSKAQIYRIIDELAARGKGIIFVSSYLPELLGVCDTIGVFCRGILSEIRPVDQWTELGIIAAAIGQNIGAVG
jgi:ribose transport system ATP-binding protein